MNILKKVIIILISVLVLSIIYTTYSLAVTGTVTTDGVRIRREPNTESEVLTLSIKDKEIEVLEQDGDWYKIVYDEYTGYMHKDYIILEEELTSNTEDVNENIGNEENISENSEETNEQNEININVHIVPIVYSSVLDSISTNVNVTSIKEMNNWVHIQYEDKDGWITKNDLQKIQSTENVNIPEETTPQEETIVEEIPTINMEYEKGYINTEKVVFRSGPSTESDPIGELVLNTEVTILQEDEEWTHVQVGEQTGYVATRLISDEATTTSRSNDSRNVEINPIIYYVNSDIVNVREDATTSSRKLGTVNLNDEIEVIGESGDFYQIIYNDEIGYIYKELLSENKLEQIIYAENSNEVADTNNQTTSGAELVAFAKQFLGYRYVYGGTSPSGGFDCSGFTYYIYNSCGYPLSRSCSAQANSGTEVAKESLQPGDLIVFNDSANRSIGHVGIYIGDRKVYTCCKFFKRSCYRHNK